MAKKEPFDDMLEKIADMLVLIQNHQDKPYEGQELSPDMKNQLQQLEDAIILYKKIAENALQLGGETPEELEQKVAHPPTDITKEQKKFQERASKLKQELANLHSKYTMYQQALEMNRKKASKKTEADKRKKKFKRLSGGDKGWMPL